MTSILQALRETIYCPLYYINFFHGQVKERHHFADVKQTSFVKYTKAVKENEKYGVVVTKAHAPGTLCLTEIFCKFIETVCMMN